MIKFLHRGKCWKLFKEPWRGKGEKPSAFDKIAPRKVYVEHNGQRYKRSTDLVEQGAAIAKAKEIVDLAIGGNVQALNALKVRRDFTPKPPKADTAVSLVGRIVSVYEQAKDLEVKPKAQIRNVQALRNVIRRALGMPLPAKNANFAERARMNAEVDALSGAIFTVELAESYYRAMRTAANAAKGDDAAQRVRITYSSLLIQATGVFVPLALANYKVAGLVIPPTLPEFLAACRSGKPGGLTAHYNPPPETVIQGGAARLAGLGRSAYVHNGWP